MNQGVQIKESVVIHLTHVLCPATEGIGPKEAGKGLVREATVSFRVRDLSIDYCPTVTKASPAEDRHSSGVRHINQVEQHQSWTLRPGRSRKRRVLDQSIFEGFAAASGG